MKQQRRVLRGRAPHGQSHVVTPQSQSHVIIPPSKLPRFIVTTSGISTLKYRPFNRRAALMTWAKSGGWQRGEGEGGEADCRGWDVMFVMTRVRCRWCASS